MALQDIADKLAKQQAKGERAKGALAELRTQAKEDHGCATLAAVDKMHATVEQKRDKAKVDLQETMKQIEEDYDL